jgi:GNAT superfamily N-acetyltransferase
VDERILLERAIGGLGAMQKLMEAACESTRLVELEQARAVVTPTVPERSLFNCVVYQEEDALERALPELEWLYEEAGTEAWTVWVRPGHARAARALEERGHFLDADPEAMGAGVEEILGRAPARDLAFEIEPGDIDVLAELNEHAYGMATGEMAAGLPTRPPGLEIYVAKVDGRTMACAAAEDQGDNCDITFVATLAEARGQGMARALMLRLLEDAHGRDCTTTTLVATKLGEPVYRKLGYQSLGALQMWERRSPADG